MSTIKLAPRAKGNGRVSRRARRYSSLYQPTSYLDSDSHLRSSRSLLPALVRRPEMPLFGKKWNPSGLHCYVTGGSQGLGLALALLLTKHGAHVSIVARNEDRLQKALAELESARQNKEQILKSYSFSLSDATQSAAALAAACEPHGGASPEAVFACAGSSKPMFFVEMTEEDMLQGMTNGYWVQAWTAFAATKQMVRQKRKGKIVLVSSTVGYMSFVGYTNYSPAKHALRGLCDTLQSELLLYGIDVHTFFPATMFTPGYENEMQTKPQITKKIEEADGGLTPEQAAVGLLKGLEKNQTHITADLITSMFRSSTRGSAPLNNYFVDGILATVAFIFVPIWRWQTDKAIVKHGKEHEEYLQKQGFFS